MADGWGGRGHLTLNPGHPIGHPGLTPTTHAITTSQLSLLSGVWSLSCAVMALPDTLDARTSCLNPSLPGWELHADVRCSSHGETGCWEFTVSERAVRQTSATRLCSSDGVSAAHYPPTLELGRGWDASSCWRRGPRGVRRGTADGRGRCLPEWFIGFSESILDREKICFNALIDIFTHLYYWICASDCNLTSNVCYLIDWCVSTSHRVKMWLSMNSKLNFWLRDTVSVLSLPAETAWSEGFDTKFKCFSV